MSSTMGDDRGADRKNATSRGNVRIARAVGIARPTATDSLTTADRAEGIEMAYHDIKGEIGEHVPSILVDGSTVRISNAPVTKPKGYEVLSSAWRSAVP
jgi:hypothetical protein